MATCTVCGNEYDKPIQIIAGDKTLFFDSFACAIHALAPECEKCGVKIIGHGVEAHGQYFCCAHCARQAGVQDVADRA